MTFVLWLELSENRRCFVNSPGIQWKNCFGGFRKSVRWGKPCWHLWFCLRFLGRERTWGRYTIKGKIITHVNFVHFFILLLVPKTIRTLISDKTLLCKSSLGPLDVNKKIKSNCESNKISRKTYKHRSV